MKWLFFILLFGLDVVSKVLAIQFISPGRGIEVFDFGPISFYLTLVTNTGAAWGFFAGHPEILFALRVAITLFLVANRSKFAFFPMWLIITGAVGNQLDYLVYGHVIDFFHFTFWGKSFAIFNVADSCITIGIMTLLFLPRKVASCP